MDRDPTPAEVSAARAEVEAGGGRFALPELTLGVFADDQPTHRLGIGSDRRRHVPLAADEGWILPAGAEGTCEFDAPLTFTSVSLSRELLAEVGLTPGAEFVPHVGAHDPLVLQMVRTVAALEADAPRLYRETMARALAAHLVQTLAPTVAAGVGEDGAIDDRRLRRALDHIHDHLGENLSLETLAAEATMSPYHFARRFKATTGRSPLQYVIRERMRTARVLLETTTLSVVEIALRVGYEDVSRFRVHFKRQHGATPSSVRDRRA